MRCNISTYKLVAIVITHRKVKRDAWQIVKEGPYPKTFGPFITEEHAMRSLERLRSWDSLGWPHVVKEKNDEL